MDELLTSDGKVLTVHGPIDQSDIPLITRETRHEKNIKMVIFFAPIVVVLMVMLFICSRQRVREQHKYLHVDDDRIETKKLSQCVVQPCELTPWVGDGEYLYANDGNLAIRLSQMDEEYVPYYDV